MNDRRKKFALMGGLLGALYLVSNHVMPSIPDFLMGLVLGIAAASLLVSLLPETAMVRLQNWKRKWLRRGK